MNEENEVLTQEADPADENWCDDVDLSDVDMSEWSDGLSTDDGVNANEHEQESDVDDQTENEHPEDTEQNSENAETDTDQFTLKHLDETVTVSRDEVMILAQKGMDYDRIKERSEQLAKDKAETDARLKELETDVELIEFVKEVARGQGITPQQFIDNTKASILSHNENIDMSVALGRIQNMRREKELETQKAALSKDSKQDKTPEKTPEEIRRQRDIQEFIQTFPNVKPDTISKDVWGAVGKGKSLVSAYLAEQNKALQAQVKQLTDTLKVQKQNNKNRQTSTGSQQSVGGGNSSDKWLEGWYDEA